MSKNKSNQTAVKEGNVTIKGLDNLKDLMGNGNPILSEDEVVKMMPETEWTKAVAQTLLDIAEMYQNSVSEELSVDLLSVYLEWVILNRINYVQNGRNQVHPKNVKYPTVMYDALAKVSRFDGVQTMGAQILPQVGDATMSEETAEILNKWVDPKGLTQAFVEGQSWVKDGKVIAFPNHEKCERLMGVAGIELATGIPMTRTVEDASFYKMSVDTNGKITTAGDAPDISAVFARCFYQFDAVVNLFGKQKVELVLYKALEAALFDVLQGYVKNFRG